jgi:PLP dependent protein
VAELFTGLDAARVRRQLDSVRERISEAGRDPAEVEVCAAIKYVPGEELPALAEAGVELVGENRAQELLSKQERHRELFSWDFIGALQSRKGGVEPAALGDFIARCPVRVGGLMTMPPFVGRPEDNRRWFARLAELASEHGLARLSMGTTQDFEVAVQEGATIVRLGEVLYA